ncbi:NAD(P)-dependent oxidoreductase [Mesorhizobium sp. BAC0120]|uniref:NAD-dependent epimerase/dehydratase family protein n=1 Tax=Mesorhizobium sp. BAC0120 TaxID=3090670 RepID=UPI00298CDD3E|nr:NAD(P)-dependent oxidoreductase [Mesorhizobium sp. BAC0120]MDW6026353.1 NAD(P)-dependent oxidoreductase [Mesorhizobium sp. BAC0120]
MKVFVSGATGVVGRRAIPLLLAQGHSVTAIVRKMPDSAAVVHGGLTFVNVDLFDPDALRRAVAGHDVVINLATHMPSAAWKMVFRSSWRLNDRIRTEGAANIAAAAREGGAARLIQESFAPTYPDSGDRWIDETTPLDPSDYNRTVLDAEAAATSFSDDGRAGVVLRFAAFYGPDAIQVQGYVDGLRKGLAVLPGGADRYISSISHDDAASAVVAALDASAGAYNVSDDEPVTRAVFFGSLAENLGLRPPRFLPSWATVLFGSVGEAAARSLRLSNRKLKEETGWSPRYPSVREGWPATLAEMKGK